MLKVPEAVRLAGRQRVTTWQQAGEGKRGRGTLVDMRVWLEPQRQPGMNLQARTTLVTCKSSLVSAE